MIRSEYRKDTSFASGDHLVLTMDYSQNLTLPTTGSTPSAWYFMSLVAVPVFGIYDAHDAKQFNFVYTERKGGKGSNEVISMLVHFLESRLDGKETLTEYADNCGGQNKNNFVLKFFMMLAHTGKFQVVNFKFFVKGHTKNACDRGFGHIRKKIEKRDCWTFEHIVDGVKEAASSSVCVPLEHLDTPFSDYKTVVHELYKNVPGLQKYQHFRMEHANPGIIECRKKPGDNPDTFDIRKSYDGIIVSAERVMQLWDGVQKLGSPAVNPEKVHDLRKNIFPYVPAEFGDDPLYKKPSAEEEMAAKDTKKARVAKRLKKSHTAASEEEKSEVQ